jgi:hypothetical protein
MKGMFSAHQDPRWLLEPLPSQVEPNFRIYIFKQRDCIPGTSNIVFVRII